MVTVIVFKSQKPVWPLKYKINIFLCMLSFFLVCCLKKMVIGIVQLKNRYRIRAVCMKIKSVSKSGSLREKMIGIGIGRGKMIGVRIGQFA